jgi:ring-1,2-phenylacetyl-CoA epoxidase subunit PaaE
LFATSTKENAIEKSLGGIQNHHHGRWGNDFWNVTKQTVLDAALKQGIDAPYSCQAEFAAAA